MNQINSGKIGNPSIDLSLSLYHNSGCSSRGEFILISRAIQQANDHNFLQAELIYRDLILTGTSNHIVYSNLSAICALFGRFNEAIDFLKFALVIKPNDPDILNNLGNAYFQRGELALALDSFGSALHFRPDFAEVFYNLGLTFKRLGDSSSSIKSYKSALNLNPNFAEAHYNLGVEYQESNELPAAISSYNSAIHILPGYLEAHINLANIYQQVGNYDAALLSYKSALILNPNSAEAHNNLGNIYKLLDMPDEAIISYTTALKINSNYSDAFLNLGNIFCERGDLFTAICFLSSAVQQNHANPEAQVSLGIAELLIGNYYGGLIKYDYRLMRKGYFNGICTHPSCSQWTGDFVQGNDRLLLISEGGLGDTLHFMRYVITLRERGFQVFICAQPQLITLIQSSGIDSSPLTPEQAINFTEGYWIRLLSVPRYLNVSPLTPVHVNPYISTTKVLLDKWKLILDPCKHPVIGINWQGNPRSEESSSLKGRSLPLQAFSVIEHGSLVSLQKGVGSEQLDSCEFKGRFIANQCLVSNCWDFLETAAIIGNCDLVITSDTSIAHLAGGMGIKTWLLLHKVPEWRWGLVGDTTFWYPTMRLFRQREHGNWSEVMERVAAALNKEFGNPFTVL